MLLSQISNIDSLQAKIAQCSVLYIHMTGLSSEVLKNLVLAGVKAVVCDNRPYPESIAETPSFFLPRVGEENNDDNLDKDHDAKRQKVSKTVAEAMQQQIEDLNPLLGPCEIVTKDVETLSNEFFARFDIVVASRISANEGIRIASALQESPKKGKFFMADCFGLYGVCCIDLGEDHTFRDDIGKSLLPPQKVKTYVPLLKMFEAKIENAVNRFHKTPPPAWVRYRSMIEYASQKSAWPSSENALNFAEVVTEWISKTSPSLINTPNSIFSDAASLRQVATLATAEIAPVCAVMGGIISNEVIKAISGKGAPSNNTLLFDGLACKAWSFLVLPPQSSK